MGRNRSPVDKYGLDLTFVNIQMVRIPNKGIGKGESGKKSLLCFVYAERIGFIIKYRICQCVHVNHRMTQLALDYRYLVCS